MLSGNRSLTIARETAMPVAVPNESTARPTIKAVRLVAVRQTTEPAAMTIGAMLLSAQFYRLKPSEPLRYATLALLFVNVSVGGALTHFAAPPVVMVAAKWGWGLKEVFAHFGVAALVAIVATSPVSIQPSAVKSWRFASWSP